MKGKELLKQGKKSEAHECFQKGVDISPEIALAFIKVCDAVPIFANLDPVQGRADHLCS